LAIPPVSKYTPAETIKVLQNPAFASWFWQDPALTEAARKLGPQPSQEARRAAVTKLAGSKFTPEVIASYQRRLRAMARWLALAAQPEMAAYAQALGDQLGTGEPADSPFVRRLIGRGLDVVIVNLHLKNLI